MLVRKLIALVIWGFLSGGIQAWNQSLWASSLRPWAWGNTAMRHWWHVCLSAHWERCKWRIKCCSHEVRRHCHYLRHRSQQLLVPFSFMLISFVLLCNSFSISSCLLTPSCASSNSLTLLPDAFFCLLYFCSSFSSGPGDLQQLTDRTGSSVGRLLTVVAEVVGQLTAGTGVVEWLDVAAGVVGRLTAGGRSCRAAKGGGRSCGAADSWGRSCRVVRASANSTFSSLSLAPSITAKLLPDVESRMWTGATDALPPIIVSNSVNKKRKISCIGVFFIRFPSSAAPSQLVTDLLVFFCSAFIFVPQWGIVHRKPRFTNSLTTCTYARPLCTTPWSCRWIDSSFQMFSRALHRVFISGNG